MNLVTEFIASIKEKNLDKVKELLLKDQSLLKAEDENGATAILISVYYGAKEVLAYLLEQQPTLNVFEASALGDVNRVKEIVIENPSDIKIYSNDGWTALHLASFFGKSEVAKILVDRGAPINVRSNNSMNNLPIHAAAASGVLDSIQILLENGSEVNEKQNGGFTPLHEAALSGNTEMVQLLLQYEANQLTTNAKDETALDLALKNNHEDIIRILSR